MAALGLAAVSSIGCGPSETQPAEQPETQHQASVRDGFMLLPDIPIAWGFDAERGQHTGGSCWDLPSNKDKYVDVRANNASIDVKHSWSSTREEAKTEVYQHLNADVDLGVVSAEVDGVYDGVFSTETESQVLTIVATIKTVTADFHISGQDVEWDLNPATCEGLSGEEMSLAEFLEKCGDHYIGRKQMGGFLIFTGVNQTLTETDKYRITELISTDYGIGDAQIDGYVDVFQKLEEAGFTFYVNIFGFPELINEFGEDSTTKIDTIHLWNEVASLRKKWDTDAADGKWDGAMHYGATISQLPFRYGMATYEECTGANKGYEALLCYETYLERADRHVPQYEIWREELNTKLANEDAYFWGVSTTAAQQSKDKHLRVRNVLDACVTRIQDATRLCTDYARDTHADGGEVCFACDPDAVYHCPTDVLSNGEVVCAGTDEPAELCSRRNLGGLYENQLDHAIPKGDTNPAYQPLPATVDQHKPATPLQDSSTHICTLAGISGKMSGGGESVRLYQDGWKTWTLATGSKQGDDDGETLVGRAWCSLLSHFFDGNGDNWTTHPDVEATAASDSWVVSAPFSDSSGATVGYKHATALNGLKGKFQGGGEWGWADRSDSPMLLKAHSEQTDLTAYGSSFGLDRPANYDIDRGTWESYSVSTRSDPSKKVAEQVMIPVNEGICYFWKITGDFDGSGEGVRIYQKDGFWRLRAKAACTGHEGWFGGGDCDERKNVQAVATCYKYDQTL